MTCSERTKRRKTEEIRSTVPVQELSYATQMSLRASGNLAASKVLQNIIKNPSKATEYIESSNSKNEKSISAEAAVAYIVEKKMSKSDYEDLRKLVLEHNSRIFPNYKMILDCKKECYPPTSDIIITEYSAEVKLQGLLDHTTRRILLLQSIVINSLDEKTLKNMILICKWGCDGTSGLSVYKQKFSDITKWDGHIFSTTIVPVQLSSDDGTIIWKNPRPSSPRFCRPIKIQFLHETPESTIKEVSEIEEQIKYLRPLESIIGGKEVAVNYNLNLTMVDGKVCNAVTHTDSAQRCYLCGATSKQFNNINMVAQRDVNKDYVRFGLSTLHAWIRFFECCLHLSYKLGIKKWQNRSREEKENVQARKRNIQKSLRSELGLAVDIPKPGFGTTNDGNTARRFFENYTISSQVTGVDETLIKRFYIILQVISSGFGIDSTKFHQYAMDTAKLYVDLYPWYYMPTTVHKLLVHGALIIQTSNLPIGQMSEDAQESLNKCIKYFRAHLSRTSSRLKSMEDVMHRLLLNSDPYISSIRKFKNKKLRSLLPEASALLQPPEISTRTEETESDDHSE